MADLAPITEAEVEDLVRTFYKYGDEHAPMVDYLPLIDKDVRVVLYPDGSGFQGLEGFEEWYMNLVRQVFDEDHNITGIDVHLSDDKAEALVDIFVEYTAKMWYPPAPNSVDVKNRPQFTWVVRRSAETHKPVITFYALTSLFIYGGSAIWIPARYGVPQFPPPEGMTLGIPYEISDYTSVQRGWCLTPESLTKLKERT